MSAVAGLRRFAFGAIAERSRVCGRVAVCAISATEGFCGAVPQLQFRRELLSAGRGSGEPFARGCEYGNERGSVAWEIIFASEGARATSLALGRLPVHNIRDIWARSFDRKMKTLFAAVGHPNY